MHAMTNGNASVARQILARSHSTSRSGSPQLTAVGMDQNAMVMAQLNSQINNLNNLNLQMTHQMSSLNDLPPPPPIPEQVSMIVDTFSSYVARLCARSYTVCVARWLIELFNILSIGIGSSTYHLMVARALIRIAFNYPVANFEI